MLHLQLWIVLNNECTIKRLVTKYDLYPLTVGHEHFTFLPKMYDFFSEYSQKGWLSRQSVVTPSYNYSVVVK